MPAAKRSSDSPIVVALVVCFILMVAGLGFGIWFYQQLNRSGAAIAASQDAVKQTVGQVFADNSWELPVNSPAELGVVYGRESFQAVATKLNTAGQYEKVIQPLLGWQSVAAMQRVVAESPIQKDLAAAGAPTVETVMGLTDIYERRYGQLTSETASLRSQVDQKTQETDSLRTQLTEAQRQFGQDLDQRTREFSDSLAKLRADYSALLAQNDQQNATAREWQQKYQAEVNQHNTEVAQLDSELEQWKQRYWAAVQGPAEGERLAPRGQVLTVDAKNDFVYIEGGEDKGLHENDVLVVYSRTPEGEDRAKGVIRIGEVYKNTCRALIVKEDEYFIEGDYFVPQDVWDSFHSTSTAAALPGDALTRSLP